MTKFHNNRAKIVDFLLLASVEPSCKLAPTFSISDNSFCFLGDNGGDDCLWFGQIFGGTRCNSKHPRWRIRRRMKK